jgi:hypothetical protein
MLFSMLSYLNREQYGDRPLFYGQYYNSPLDRNESSNPGKKEWRVKDGKYIVTNEGYEPNYDDEYCTFFPRMWSKSDPRHEQEYKRWGKIKGTKKTVRGQSGETETIIKPTFSENFRFFVNYQINFMYWRLFYVEFRWKTKRYSGPWQQN